MKHLLLTLLTATAISASAQSPTLTTSHIPQAGDVFITQPVDATTLSEGTAGTHQTWDFSAITDNGASTTEFVVAPSATPYASLYPGATVALVTTDGTDSAVGYEQLSGTDLAYLGNYMTQTAGVYYNPARIAFHYPMTYGDTYAHTFTGTSDNGDAITGVDSFTVDGYGTLHLPHQTFTDVLRLRRAEHSQSVNSGGGFYINIDQVEYVFYTPSYHDFLFDIQYTTNNVNGTIITGKTAQYAKSVTTGITDMEKENAITVYPNPAENTLHITLPDDNKEGQVKLFNTTGQLVLDQSIASQNEIAVKDLPRGIYTLQLSNEKGVSTRKVVLQ